jgi:nucleoside-diphosphate-sugar epimerase
MRILVTAADTLLGAALCEQLAGTYQVEAAGWAEPFAEDATTARLTRAAEAVVHLAPIYAGDRDTADGLVDYATRRSYNLLQAFAATGNRRVIYVSTLRLLDEYPPHFAVTENWRPRPTAADPAVLASHLGEILVKEFARDGLITALTLRLGFPLVPGERGPHLAGAATAMGDAADGVARSLQAGLSEWHTVHLQSPIANPRFLLQGAERLLGFPDGAVPTDPPRLPGS